MLDPNGLYELAEGRPDVGSPVLIVALPGMVDAGGAVRLTGEHLLTTLESTMVATYDVDQLIDYRARRPPLLFNVNRWEHYEEPSLAIHLMRDGADTPFLLLTGPEPDYQWKRFLAATMNLIAALNVKMTVGLASIPMAVPHTRPAGVTAHATRPELIAGHEPWLRRIQVPSSASHLLEYELGRAGRDALGFAAHVPHYLAQSDYPAATEVLMTSVSKATGLMLPLAGLAAAAAAVRENVDSQLESGGEAAAVVHALEEQYDEATRERGERGEPGEVEVDGDGLPTADELGDVFERFLAEQSEPGSGGPQ
jgi:hypothetical protein